MFKRIFWLFILLLNTSAFAEEAPRRQILIDTDAAFDDDMAIAYLLKEPHLEVNAITVSADKVGDCEAGLKNIDSILSLMNIRHVEVGCGKEKTLKGNHHFPEVWSRSSRITKNFEVMSNKHHPKSAVQIIKEVASEAEQPIDIVALGPLTNIASAIKMYPSIIKKIRMIYIMGGAVYVPGNLQYLDPNLNKTAEWNIYVDPYAAKIIFRSGVAITLIPLDVTNNVPFDWNFYSQLGAAKTSDVANALHKVIKNNEDLLMHKEWYFFDPLAAVIASDESIAKYKTEKLTVLTKSEKRSGTIIINNNKGMPVRICTEVNKEKFEEAFLKNWAR